MNNIQLHIMVRQLIDNQGTLYVSDKRFFNILCDMGCFEDFRKCKIVFKSIVEDGYANKILTFYHGEQSKEETFQSLFYELETKYKYSINDISFCVQNLLYGLGLLTNVESYSLHLNYNWLYKLIDTTKEEKKEIGELDSEFVVLNNVPSDAKVFVDSMSIPNDGDSIVLDLSYGKHILKVLSPLYHAYEKTIVIDKENPEPINIDPKPKFGSLLIMTNTPEPAIVFIDNVKMGETPFSSAIVMSGTHTLKLISPLYQDYQGTFTMSDGEKKKLDIQMVGNFGDVILDTDDKSVSVFIDGEKKGCGKWKGKLSIGKHQVQCFKDAHSSTTFDIYVNQGKDKANHIILPKLKGIYGCLVVNVKPIGAEIYIDNQLIGKSPLKYRNAIIGKHTLVIQHPECKSMAKEIYISEDEIITESSSLTKICSRNYQEAKVGDYFYNDGTFSSRFIIDKKTIGIIYSLETSEEEKRQGWMHGRIFSLHAIPANVQYSPNRIPSIYADLKMEKESKYYSSWAIPSIDEWNKIFNNLTGTKIGQYISRQKWNSFHRLNVKLDAFPRFASFTNGHVNIIFYSEKQQCFLYNGSSVSKIRGIAAF